MKLIDLNPSWIDREWEGRSKIGLRFKCTHCGEECMLFFSNPLDGGTPKGPDLKWQVTSGDTFSNLTITPSVDWTGHMHVNIANGEVHKS